MNFESHCQLCSSRLTPQYNADLIECEVIITCHDGVIGTHYCISPDEYMRIEYSSCYADYNFETKSLQIFQNGKVLSSCIHEDLLSLKDKIDSLVFFL